MGAIKRATTAAGGERWWFWCEPCSTHHVYTTKLGEGETGPVWSFNGDEEHPSFTPSLLCNRNLTPEHKAAGGHRCHLYLTGGMVRYLGDCTHAMAGQSVPVQPPCF